MSQILIVEDEVHIAEFIRDLLDEEGYQTQVARDGREALELLRKFSPRLIISDIMMPHMGGIELCRILNGTPAFATIPIILTSAGPRPAKASGCRFALFIAKPYDIPVLLRAIASILPRETT